MTTATWCCTGVSSQPNRTGQPRCSSGSCSCSARRSVVDVVGIVVVGDQQLEPRSPAVIGRAFGVEAEHVGAVPEQRRRVRPRADDRPRRRRRRTNGSARVRARTAARSKSLTVPRLTRAGISRPCGECDHLHVDVVDVEAVVRAGRPACRRARTTFCEWPLEPRACGSCSSATGSAKSLIFFNVGSA